MKFFIEIIENVFHTYDVSSKRMTKCSKIEIT